MRPQPLISVTDVPRSSRWYQELLGCESGHGGEQYERLGRDGSLVLQLHRFDVEHHHGRIGDPGSRPYGNGVALWFEIDDFDDAVQRAARLAAEVVLPPHRNPPMGRAGRHIASCGYGILTATWSCSRALTVNRPGPILASADAACAEAIAPGLRAPSTAGRGRAEHDGLVAGPPSGHARELEPRRREPSLTRLRGRHPAS